MGKNKLVLIIIALILGAGLIWISEKAPKNLASSYTKPFNVSLKTENLAVTTTPSNLAPLINSFNSSASPPNLSLSPLSPSSGPSSPSNEALNDLPILGKAGAKVLKAGAKVLVEVYSDYQCPFSGRYYMEDIKKLISEYVETGKVRLVYRELAFEGDRSQWAAEAARCANDQGQFWAYHDKILTERVSQNSTEVYEKSNLKKYAAELGLNSQKFNECLDSGKYAALVQEKTNEALKSGINGTPTTKINGQIVTNDQGEALGAMPYEMLKEKIEKALAQ